MSERQAGTQETRAQLTTPTKVVGRLAISEPIGKRLFPTHPTRIGNSVNRDTTPDLTMVKRASLTEWHNTGQTFGSDHCNLQTLIAAGPRKRVGRTLSITDWDAFRACRAARPQKGVHPTSRLGPATSLLMLRRRLNGCRMVVQAPKSLTVNNYTCWRLRKRYKTQKLNRTLHKRIGILNTDIEKYALQLTNQQWNAVCNGMQRQSNIPKTWNILRHLLDGRTSKTTQQRNIQKFLHQTQATDKQLLSNLVDKYLGDQVAQAQMPNTGQDNASFDAPITLAEVQATVRNLRPNSATIASPVGSYKMQHINIVWESGSLPAPWKHGMIVFIPKPGC
ncbi:hypothetical protein HPB52_012860 [Rhipicephalus sanguineus]|uniref:Tick transposon n=1 Tax=Rhipicephalus sanguineus TaxID=34632 RepID=A0A9D4PW93_RHISA|nr:hypothetical protein HPB52_012860 [Rhipicephalus sanguineus]